jgi:hypothetical protein
MRASRGFLRKRDMEEVSLRAAGQSASIRAADELGNNGRALCREHMICPLF